MEIESSVEVVHFDAAVWVLFLKEFIYRRKLGEFSPHSAYNYYAKKKKLFRIHLRRRRLKSRIFKAKYM